MDSRELLSVGDVARRSGYAASALRYYEAEGLIAATRTAGGRRQFQRSVLRRLAFIRAASNIGLTLEEIRAELDRLPAGRVPTEGRLAADLAALAGPARRPDRRTGAAARRSRLVHRVRLPVAPAVPDVQPRRRMATSDDAPGAANLPPLLRRPHQMRGR